MGVGFPSKTGLRRAENGKESPEGSRAQGRVRKGPLTVKRGRLI